MGDNSTVTAPRPGHLRVAVCCLATALGASACADGGLSIRLLLPEDEALSPTSGEPVAEVALEARALSGESQRLSRSVGEPGAGIELGSLLPGDEFVFAVELRSANQQLLGYGQTPGAIEISGGSATVELNVRRPLAYLSNLPGSLAAFDATRDLANTVTVGIGLSGTPSATTCTLDGSEILVAIEEGAASKVLAFSTSQHLLTREVVTGLAPLVNDMALSADGRFVVTAHDDNNTTGGVSIIDVEAGTFRHVELGPARRIAIDNERGEVFVLVNASFACGPTSQITRISLGDSESGRVLPFSSAASDIAFNPQTGALIVADPCMGQVVAIDGADAISPLFDLEAASAVAVSSNMLFASGVGGTPLRVRIASAGLDGLDPVLVELPAMVERSRSLDFEEPDQSAEIIANADAAEVLDLAAVPGSDRIAVLTRARYDITGDSFAIPNQTLTGWEYQLVDTSTGSQIQRVRTRCQLDVDYRGELLADWRCAEAPDQQQTDVEFEPKTISILYGAR